jgi:hypothetical protein
MEGVEGRGPPGFFFDRDPGVSDRPLAREGISVFALSTYDTDYLLVKEEKLAKAIQALREEGYAINKVRSSELGVRSRRKRLRPEGSSPKSARPRKS